MKKLLTVVAGIGSGLVALAQEGTGGPVSYSGSIAETIVEDASDSLQNFLEGAAETIAAVIIAGLAIWGGIKLVGIIKSAFQTGKGR